MNSVQQSYREFTFSALLLASILEVHSSAKQLYRELLSDPALDEKLRVKRIKPYGYILSFPVQFGQDEWLIPCGISVTGDIWRKIQTHQKCDIMRALNCRKTRRASA